MDWRPTAPAQARRARSRLLARIRAFFAHRGVIEVETPALSAAGATDPHLDSLRTIPRPPTTPQARLLATSPEFPMKRLLADEATGVYQLARVFRPGEVGRRHNVEFTLLEWYRPGFDHHALMAEVEQLLAEVLAPWRPVPPARTVTYRELFLEHTGLDPLAATSGELRDHARARGLVGTATELDERDHWLDLLLSLEIAPGLPDAPLLVRDYPASQAALARLRPDAPQLAERFELYWGGLELANGYRELTDAVEQRARFQRDNETRRVRGLAEVPVDERLLAALDAGLPECSGVALGVDRLLMVALRASTIDEVIAFPYERA